MGFSKTSERSFAENFNFFNFLISNIGVKLLYFSFKKYAQQLEDCYQFNVLTRIYGKLNKNIVYERKHS